MIVETADTEHHITTSISTSTEMTKGLTISTVLANKLKEQQANRQIIMYHANNLALWLKLGHGTSYVISSQTGADSEVIVSDGGKPETLFCKLWLQRT